MLLENGVILSSLVTLLVLLSACGLVDSKPSSAVFPHLVSYSPEFQNQLADEIESMKPPCAADVASEHCSAAHRAVIDYGNMREETRAIANSR